MQVVKQTFLKIKNIIIKDIQKSYQIERRINSSKDLINAKKYGVIKFQYVS